MIAPVAAHIADEFLADPATPEWLGDPMFRPALMAWANAEAACELLRTHLAGLDLGAALADVTETDEDETRDGSAVRRVSTSRRVESALERLRRWEVHSANLRARLGLDPVSRARLGRDLAGQNLDIARMMAALPDRKDDDASDDDPGPADAAGSQG